MCVILLDCYMIEPREIKTNRYHNEVDVDWKIPKEKLKYEKYHNGSNSAPLVYGNHFCHNLFTFHSFSSFLWESREYWKQTIVHVTL